jgi:uncharacterized membrane protein YozB (DUF420 family)
MTVGTLSSSAARHTAPAVTLGRRYFHTGAAAVMLAVTIAGFYPYYLRGVGMGERTIDPTLTTLVLAHGGLATLWFVLFLLQAALIPAGLRRVHMRLGWAAAAVAFGVAVSGSVLAVASARLSPDLPFLGMAYGEFLMVMLTEMAVFAALVGAGLWWRRKPERHRAMMLLASLSILAGATVRMPAFHPVFGQTGWVGLFGPIFTLGVILVGTRGWMTARLDRCLTGGFLALFAAYVLATTMAVTVGGRGLLRAIFGF